MDKQTGLPKPRFIAGAVCPGCGQMDKLKAWVAEEIQYRECVACGFVDRMSVNSPQGIPTRVDPGAQNASGAPGDAARAPDAPASVQPLQFHPRPPKKP